MIDYKSLYLLEKKRILAQQNEAKSSAAVEERAQKGVPSQTAEETKGQPDRLVVPDLVEIDERYRRFKVGEIRDVYYIPEFIDGAMERELAGHVYSEENKGNWTQLKRRRLQNWGGIPLSSGMKEEELPAWLNALFDRVMAETPGIFPRRPNHALINEYNQNEGIMPHKDGPNYYPLVFILSLNGSCIMDFYSDLKEAPAQQLFIQPRSLLIFTNDAYKQYFHGIRDVVADVITEKVVNRTENEPIGKEIDRDIRLSFTIRIVPNSYKSNSK